MSKVKRQVEDLKMEDPLAAESPKPTPPSNPKETIKVVAVDPGGYNLLIKYLETKPYKEVQPLLEILNRSQLIDATVIREVKG